MLAEICRTSLHFLIGAVNICLWWVALFGCFRGSEVEALPYVAAMGFFAGLLPPYLRWGAVVAAWGPVIVLGVVDGRMNYPDVILRIAVRASAYFAMFGLTSPPLRSWRAMRRTLLLLLIGIANLLGYFVRSIDSALIVFTATGVAAGLLTHGRRWGAALVLWVPCIFLDIGEGVQPWELWWVYRYHTKSYPQPAGLVRLAVQAGVSLALIHLGGYLRDRFIRSEAPSMDPSAPPDGPADSTPTPQRG